MNDLSIQLVYLHKKKGFPVIMRKFYGDIVEIEVGEGIVIDLSCEYFFYLFEYEGEL